MGNKPPYLQKNEEWWDDYDGASSDSDAKTITPICKFYPRQTESKESSVPRISLESTAAIPSSEKLTGEFRFRGHRTTCKSRLVLEFEHVETRTVVFKFFNVLVESLRTGKKYRVGEGGQFTYRERHKINGFLIDMLGASPFRPSRAHHELHKLKHFNFVGEAILEYGKNGQYWKLTTLQRKA